MSFDTAHGERRLKECKDEVDESVKVLHRRMDDFVKATASIKEIHDDVKQMREILDAWNSAKGFVTTIKFLSAMIKWTAIVGGTVGVVWYFFKFGHLPDK